MSYRILIYGFFRLFRYLGLWLFVPPLWLVMEIADVGLEIRGSPHSPEVVPEKFIACARSCKPNNAAAIAKKNLDSLSVSSNCNFIIFLLNRSNFLKLVDLRRACQTCTYVFTNSLFNLYRYFTKGFLQTPETIFLHRFFI